MYHTDSLFIILFSTFFNAIVEITFTDASPTSLGDLIHLRWRVVSTISVTHHCVEETES